MSKILIIEDEEIVLEPLCDLLRFENFEVVSAVTGEEGIAKSVTSDPDLILCDIMLPGIDGYEVLKAIKANRQTMDVPFLFLSARVERLDMRRGMELGAEDYLCKPVPKRELLAAIRTQLGKRRRLKDFWCSTNEASS